MSHVTGICKNIKNSKRCFMCINILFRRSHPFLLGVQRWPQRYYSRAVHLGIDQSVSSAWTAAIFLFVCFRTTKNGLQSTNWRFICWTGKPLNFAQQVVARSDWHIPNRIWRHRRIVWTRDYLYIARTGGLEILDMIPLHEIAEVVEMDDEPEPNSNKSPSTPLIKTDLGHEAFESKISVDRRKDKKQSSSNALHNTFLSQARLSNVLQIKTTLDGLNSGRTYYLSTRSLANAIVCKQNIHKQLLSLVKTAKRKAEAKTRYQRSQDQVKAVQSSTMFQVTMATLIIVVTVPMPRFRTFREQCIVKIQVEVHK